jgi:hypothetical protein
MHNALAQMLCLLGDNMRSKQLTSVFFQTPPLIIILMVGDLRVVQT